MGQHPNSLANLRRGGGRPKGSENRRTLSGAERAAKLAPLAWKRLGELIADGPGDAVALGAVRLVLLYAHGRPHMMEVAEDAAAEQRRMERVDSLFAVMADPEADREIGRLRARLAKYEGAAEA